MDSNATIKTRCTLPFREGKSLSRKTMQKEGTAIFEKIRETQKVNWGDSSVTMAVCMMTTRNAKHILEMSTVT